MKHLQDLKALISAEQELMRAVQGVPSNKDIYDASVIKLRVARKSQEVILGHQALGNEMYVALKNTKCPNNCDDGVIHGGNNPEPCQWCEGVKNFGQRLGDLINE